ncbi:MAG: lysophospholipid acyltransferase family protein [Bacteroidia bacterium]
MLFLVIYLLSLLPFWIIYFLSDFLFFLLYYLVGYRKKIVFQNLKNTFPEKTEQEILVLSKKYFRYMSDLIFETIKIASMTKKDFQERCIIEPETINLFNELYAQKKNMLFVMGHFGNFEWCGHPFSLLHKHQLYVIYRPLSNKLFDKLMYQLRARFGTIPVTTNDMVRTMIEKRNEINVTAFIADQTPAPENAYWTTFLNQETPVFTGTEKIARKFNYPLIFVNVKRIKRGYYSVNTDRFPKNPADTTEGEISEWHTRKLEQEIIRQPEIWLWSHRRWKHKRRK